MTDVRLFYATAPDLACAEEIADALVEKRLAACVNLIPGMRSLYRWRGKIEAADEIVLIVKTTAGAAAAARSLICERHPDDVPCVVAIEIAPEGSNPDFLDWIARETGPE